MINGFRNSYNYSTPKNSSLNIEWKDGAAKDLYQRVGFKGRKILNSNATLRN